MSVASSNGAHRVAELDGLRAFAVLAVVVYHVLIPANVLQGGAPWLRTLIRVSGESGVNVFFVISGYIITSLLMREHAASPSPSLRPFYIRRFCRIVPPFAVYLAALVLLRAYGLIAVSSSNLLWSALFLGDTNLLNPDGWWFVAHSWSLAVEEQFYLIFPPLLWLAFRFARNVRRTLLVSLGLAFAFCVVASGVARIFAWQWGKPWENLIQLNHFRFIIVGVLVATHGDWLLARLKKTSRWLPAIAAALILLSHLADPLPTVLSAVRMVVDPVLFVCLVMWFMQNPDRCAPLRWRVVQWLGLCSYSIYLWQQLFDGPPDAYTVMQPFRADVMLGAILACSAASHYLVERPWIALGRRLSKKFAR